MILAIIFAAGTAGVHAAIRDIDLRRLANSVMFPVSEGEPFQGEYPT